MGQCMQNYFTNFEIMIMDFLVFIYFDNAGK